VSAVRPRGVAMLAVGLIVAVFVSALYGALLGVGWFVIYALRGAPGATGMEVLVVAMLTFEATFAGTAAAAISLLLPRTSPAWSGNFVLLVAAAFVLQTLISLPPFLTSPTYLQHSALMWAMLMSGPVDWTKSSLNWSWLYTIPLTLGICSPWFRSRFDG
jgi:hypothetical protein